MRFFTIKTYLLTFFIYTTLIMQQTIAMPPQELSSEPAEPYATALFIFFCAGTLFCALFHKYCLPQQEIPSPAKIVTEEELLQELQARMLSNLKNNQEKTY